MFRQGQLAVHGLAILLGRNEAGISNRGKIFLHHAVFSDRLTYNLMLDLENHCNTHILESDMKSQPIYNRKYIFLSHGYGQQCYLSPQQFLSFLSDVGLFSYEAKQTQLRRCLFICG